MATLWLFSFIIHDLNVSQNVTRCVYVLWLFLRICLSMLINIQITIKSFPFWSHLWIIYKKYCPATHNWAKKSSGPAWSTYTGSPRWTRMINLYRESPLSTAPCLVWFSNSTKCRESSNSTVGPRKNRTNGNPYY